ncbi:DMT family transporter [Hyalangium rubrum]|uniref:DMT family transporter n=1 Tax=Hyalangium rubrum TaxID=3103134 RepID=A0ABU5HGE4_9BACT|nr:DMT family transporter [Hyalangium sp. s54d21]MDY7231929.1 DMT family transporter [Hyalangium sp. s54d21]
MALTILWGVAFVVVKDALGHGDPFTFLALRFGVGAAVLSAMARRRMFEPSHLRRGTVLGVFLFAGFAFQTVGLATTTPSRSAFITGLYVLFVPLVLLVLFRRVPRVSSLLGVVLSAVGLYFLTRPEVGSTEGLSRGDGLTLAGAMAYAVHVVLTERYAPKEGVVALVAVQLWVVSLGAVLFLPFVEARVAWTPAFVGAVLFCGVMASAVAIGLQTWAQARTSAVRAVIIYSLEAVFTAVASVALGYETLGVREWVGGSLIVLSVLVSELSAAVWDWRRARQETQA